LYFISFTILSFPFLLLSVSLGGSIRRRIKKAFSEFSQLLKLSAPLHCHCHQIHYLSHLQPQLSLLFLPTFLRTIEVQLSSENVRFFGSKLKFSLFLLLFFNPFGINVSLFLFLYRLLFSFTFFFTYKPHPSRFDFFHQSVVKNPKFP